MLKTCDVCGDDFETRKKTAKYCSKICHDEFQRGYSRLYPQLNDFAWLEKRYVAENKTMQEIANEIGCRSTTTVEQKLKFFDIKPHSKGHFKKFSKKEDKIIMRFYEKYGTAATCAKFNCSYSDLGNMRRRTETSLVLDYEGVDSKKGCIYIIRFDSCNDDLRRYVGRTEQQPPDQRFKQHIQDASNGSKKSLHVAIRNLDPKEQPIFEIVQDSLSKDDICQAESTWEQRLANEGYKMLNGCKAGGGGLSGHSARRKRSLRQKRLVLFDQFYKREKHGLVPMNHIEDGITLGRWINKQRVQYRKGYMSVAEIDELEKHEGWIWNPYQFLWDRNISELEQYVEEHGDANVPQSYVMPSGIKLGIFVKDCRQAYKENIKRKPLSKKQIGELKKLGWTPKSLPRAKKTSCGKGHIFDDANTYIDGKGQRYCRTCRGLAMTRHYTKLTSNVN